MLQDHVLFDAPAWLDALAFAPRAPRASPAIATDYPPATPAVLEAARARLKRHGPAVTHKRGNEHTFVTGAILYHDFALADEEALPLALEWNATCEPPWDPDELKTVLAHGATYASGARGAARAEVEAWTLFESAIPAVAPAPNGVHASPAAVAIPLELDGDYGVAAKYVLNRLLHDSGQPTLRRWQGDFYSWDAARGCYAAATEERVERDVAWGTGSEDAAQSRRLVAALKGVPGVLVDEASLPGWFVAGGPDPRDSAACPNGVLRLDTGELVPPTPAFFTTSTLGAEYDPASPPPARWVAFLDQIFPGDPESVAALQEWFGYCLTPDTRQQKIAFFVGGRRSGKGTTLRVLTALVGRDAVANPRLSALGTNFGLWPLIGKNLAVVGDARLGGRADLAQVTESLLSISGEDGQTIDRKHREPWTGTLSTRFVISSNELPQFADASGTVASRMLVWDFRQSFAGREDTELTEAILGELPGVLLWAVEGWRRLRGRGRFAEPASSREASAQMEEMASPARQWFEARCVRDPDAEIASDRLYGDFRGWCTRTGNKERSDAVFGRDLRALQVGAVRYQKRVGRERSWYYKGIRLRAEEEPE